MVTNTDTMKAIAQLAKGEEKDPSLAPLLYKKKCFYLLSILNPNDEWKIKLQTTIVMNTLRTQTWYHICEPVFAQLQQFSIPYAVMKGAVLSLTAYGSTFYRSSGDIDLLINRKHVNKLKNILLENGFVQGKITDHGIVPYSRAEIVFQASLSHQTAPFVKETGNPLVPYINIDINLDLFWRESKRNIDMEFVLSQIENVEIGGVQTNKLCREMEFVALCLHHYKDMNSLYLLTRFGLRLDEFCDLYFYLKQNNLNVTKLLSISEELDVKEYIYYCVFYTNQIFCDSALQCYLERLYTPEGEKILNHFGLCSDEYTQWNLSFEERLLSEHLPEYLTSILEKEKIKKIQVNREMME